MDQLFSEIVKYEVDFKAETVSVYLDSYLIEGLKSIIFVETESNFTTPKEVIHYTYSDEDHKKIKDISDKYPSYYHLHTSEILAPIAQEVCLESIFNKNKKDKTIVEEKSQVTTPIP